MAENSIKIMVQKSPGSKDIRILIIGPTKRYKENLSALGFRWGRTASGLGIFDFDTETVLGWYKYVPEQMLHETLSSVSFMKASIVEESDSYSELYNELTGDYSFDVKEDYKANWNGRVYESPEEGCYIFVSGKKKFISEEDAVLLKEPSPPNEILAKYNLKVRREESELL